MINKTMTIDGFQDIIDVVKKTGETFKNINKREDEDTDLFLNESSTQSFISYLNTTYTTDQLQKELGANDIVGYIKKLRKESWESKIDKVLHIAGEIVGTETKPALHKLKEDIKQNDVVKNISFVGDIGKIISGEENNGGHIGSLISDFIILSNENDRTEFLKSHGIPANQEEIKKPETKESFGKTNNNAAEINNNKDITPELKEKVYSVFEKYSKKNSVAPIAPEKFIEIMNKYGIPLELGLAQAIIESNIGTSGGRPTKTKNIFNVGNVDNGSNKYMDTREDGIENYAKLLKEKYSDNQGVVNTEYLLKNGFKNKNGNKYATDPNYINKLSTTIDGINEIIA